MNSPSIASSVREALLSRFLRYVAIDTESDPTSTTYPSTEKQLDLLRLLRDELIEMGVPEVRLLEKGYVMAQIPATPGYEDRPALGLIAHADTSPDFTGRGVRPQIIEDYDGSPIALGDTAVLTAREFPELMELLGHTLITTDGSTLLGADDKAGVAEIMETVRYILAHPELPHGKICIGFTPDEEIAKGVDFFDVKAFGADFAFTVDGSREGELEYENFNAASARVVAHGRSIHPGSAKGKMINALEAIYLLHAALPHYARPEFTEGYEGFYHLLSIHGDEARATSSYIVRDHRECSFEARKATLRHIEKVMNELWGAGTVTLTIEEEYRNMESVIEGRMYLIDYARQAAERAGLRAEVSPIRGGTDGSQLSFRGLPCPNLGTGGHGYHGPFEHTTVEGMDLATTMAVELVKVYAQN